MKPIGLAAFFISCFISCNLFAQSPKAIEADLLKSFKKIEYWNDHQRKGPYNAGDSDSLAAADDRFAKKLQYYAEKFPSTINQKFTFLKAHHLDISSSTDSLFRIYSWDDQAGGTMRYFDNIFQYKSGVKTTAIVDTPRSEGDIRPNYYKMYTFNASGRTYYLAAYLMIGSTKDMEQGIQVFDIENGKLNDDVKLIKTKTGLHSKLYFDYLFDGQHDYVFFDQQSKTIRIPLVASSGWVTRKFITYKFTGQYFEKVKN